MHLAQVFLLRVVLALALIVALASCGGTDPGQTPPTTNALAAYRIGAVITSPVQNRAGVDFLQGVFGSGFVVTLPRLGETRDWSPYPEMGPIPSVYTAPINGLVRGLLTFTPESGWTQGQSFVDTSAPINVIRSISIASEAQPLQLAMRGVDALSATQPVQWWLSNANPQGSAWLPARAVFNETDDRTKWQLDYRFASDNGAIRGLAAFYTPDGPKIRRRQAQQNWSPSDVSLPLYAAATATPSSGSAQLHSAVFAKGFELIEVEVRGRVVDAPFCPACFPPQISPRWYATGTDATNFVPLDDAISSITDSLNCGTGYSFSADRDAAFQVRSDDSITALVQNGRGRAWLGFKKGGGVERLFAESCDSSKPGTRDVDYVRLLPDSTRLAIRSATTDDNAYPNLPLSFTENERDVRWESPLPDGVVRCRRAENSTSFAYFPPCFVPRLSGTNGDRAIVVFSNGYDFAIQPVVHVAVRIRAGEWSYLGSINLANSLQVSGTKRLNGIEYIKDGFYVFGQSVVESSSQQFVFRVGP